MYKDCKHLRVPYVFILPAISHIDDKKRARKKIKDNAQQVDIQMSPPKKQKRTQPQPKHTSKTKKEKSSTDDKVEKLNEVKVKAKQGKKSAIHEVYVQANNIFSKNNAELKKRLAELQKQLLKDTETPLKV